MRTPPRGHWRPHRGFGRPPSRLAGQGLSTKPARAVRPAAPVYRCNSANAASTSGSAAWVMCRVSWWWHQSINDRF